MILRTTLVLSLALTISACSAFKPEKEIVTETKIVRQNIPIQARPKQIDFPEVDWYVVTEDNLEEFLQRIEQDAGKIVWMAVTPKGYENLSVGMQELRRYILQQKEIIVYYETALSEVPE